MMHLKSRLQALADLMGRYRRVFQVAWETRHQDQIEGYLSHEIAFLPAALALKETPVSPAPRVAMWLIISFAGIVFVWAIVGQIDIVASAQGKIVPNDRIKTIQPFETSTVKRIAVVDGQLVKAGDVLIELDSTMPDADKRHVEGDWAMARLQVWRAQVMLQAIKSHKPPVLSALAKTIEGIDRNKVREAEHLVIGQYEEYHSKLLSLDDEIARHRAELRSTSEMVRKLEHTIPLVRQRAQDFKAMADQQFVAHHEFLEREQLRLEQEGDLATQRSRMKEMEAAIQEVQGKRSALTAETRRVALDSWHDGSQKAAALEQDLLKARSHGELMTLTSPVSGTVQQLAIHTVGGVVTPAQPLMVIVPGGHSLEIEAFIENKDIGFVKENQEAEIKIETFQYTKYGTIHAKVLSVSHDAINDEKRGLIYASRIKMDRATMQVEGTAVHLSPGMSVSVEIKTGKRRVIEYFLSPLLAYKHESLQER
jgi:hemolysin D